MSDLRPTGIEMEFPYIGKRHLLFTLNSLDTLQEEFGKPVIELLKEMFEGEERESRNATRAILKALLDDEVAIERWRNPNSDIESLTSEQVGWIVNAENITITKVAILKAYKISMPEGGDEDPNVQSSQSE